MAHPLSLEVTPRQVVGTKKLHALRRQGLLPGVVYGFQVQNGLPVQVDRRTFEQVYRRSGANSLIKLHIDGGTTTPVFVQEIKRHPVSHELLHVDFRAVNLDEPITADVSIVLVGESAAVRQGEGVLLQMLDTVHIRALPAQVPSNIEIDVSELAEVGQAIHVSDLQLPAEVEVLTDPDQQIVQIAAMRKVAEEEEAATEAAEAEAAEAGDEDEAEG